MAATIAMASSEYVPVSLREDGDQLSTVDSVPSQSLVDDAERANALLRHSFRSSVSSLESTPYQPNSLLISQQAGGHMPTPIDFDDRRSTTHSLSSVSDISETRTLLNATQTDQASRPQFLGPELRKLSTQERLRYALSPQTHHEKYAQSCQSSISSVNTADDPPTAQVYSFWLQTKRLWRLAAFEWFATAALCASFAGVLVSYSRQLLKPNEVSTFSAVVTILNFLLGVNLAASMRSYAKLLRWLLVSLAWQPLETFDLTLGCDSLLNVCKLVWKAKNHKSRSLRCWTIGLGLIWLSTSIFLTFTVGMIGNSYSPQPALYHGYSQPGTVLITNFSMLDSGELRYDLSRIRQVGVEASYLKCNGEKGMINCFTFNNGSAWHGFRSWNPDVNDTESISMRSRWRDVDTSVRCEEFDILAGADGNSPSIKINQNGTTQKKDITPDRGDVKDIHVPGSEGIVAWSTYCGNCTGRTTLVEIFIPAVGNGKAQFFQCNSSVSQVRRFFGKDDWRPAPDEWQFSTETARSDRVARMLAGAIGWTGDVYVDAHDTVQAKVYKDFTEIAKNLRMANNGTLPLTNINASNYIATFTTRAIAKLDESEPRLDKKKEAQGDVPLQSQRLEVNWLEAGLLLAGIPSLQLIACVLVFVFANKAIIKDDSPLAMAKLYLSILNNYGLDKKGCMLRGDQIVDYVETRAKGFRDDPSYQPKFRYWWTHQGQSDYGNLNNTIGHIDVFEEAVYNNEKHHSIRVAPWERNGVLFKQDIQYDGMGTSVDSSEQMAVRKRGI